MTVLVTGGHSAKALIITRSLGKRGIKVVTSSYKGSVFPTKYSKYSIKDFYYPSPAENEKEFIKCILQKIEEYDCNLILPTHSEETYYLAKYKNKLPRSVYLPLPNFKLIMKVDNKKTLMEMAEEINVPIPNTFSFSAEKPFNEQLEEFKDKIIYPCVIKLQTGTSSKGLSYCNNFQELKTTLNKTISKFNLKPSELPIIQEFIKGDGYGGSVLYDHGKLKAIFIHKRLREYPPTGGPSTLRIGVKNQKLIKITKKLMDNLNWHGIAMVEYKITKDGEPYLMEINPRFWGSLNQAIQSGVDFPYLIYKLANNEKFEVITDYKEGLKTRYYMNDLRVMFSKHSKKYERSILDWFPRKSIPDDVLSLNDPIPALLFFYSGLIQLFKKKYVSI